MFSVFRCLSFLQRFRFLLLNVSFLLVPDHTTIVVVPRDRPIWFVYNHSDFFISINSFLPFYSIPFVLLELKSLPVFRPFIHHLYPSEFSLDRPPRLFSGSGFYRNGYLSSPLPDVIISPNVLECLRSWDMVQRFIKFNLGGKPKWTEYI